MNKYAKFSKTNSYQRPIIEMKKPRPTPAAKPADSPPPRADLPPRTPLEPAEVTLSGWPLYGHDQQRHAPLRSGCTRGIQFFRCGCGLLLIESETTLYWVPVTTSWVRLQNLEDLQWVLSHRCHAADRAEQIERRRAAQEAADRGAAKRAAAQVTKPGGPE